MKKMWLTKQEHRFKPKQTPTSPDWLQHNNLKWFFGGKYPTYHSAATRAESMRPKKTFVHLKANEGELWTVYVSHSSALYLKKGWKTRSEPVYWPADLLVYCLIRGEAAWQHSTMWKIQGLVEALDWSFLMKQCLPRLNGK